MLIRSNEPLASQTEMPLRFQPLQLRITLLCVLFLFVAVGCTDQDNEAPDEKPTDTAVQIEAAETPSEDLTSEPETLATDRPTTITGTGLDGTTPIAPNGQSLHLAWTYATGAPINHPLLRVGDIIVIVPEKGPLLALDAETGALRWQYDPPDRIWDRAYATDGQLLFVGVEGGKLVALDVHTGEERWNADLSIDVQVPPLVVGDVLYVPTTFVGPGLSNDPEGRAKLFALNNSDGSQRWQFESGNYILQTPFLNDDTLYVAGVFHDPSPIDEGGHTRLYALDAEDGDEQWVYESEDGFPKQLYATDSAVVFIGYQDYANGVDSTTGSLLWRRDTGNWVPSLSGVGNIVYFGSANTVVHALNVNDGSIVWEHNIEEGTFNYVLGAPVHVGEVMYFITQHGDLMALNALTGELRWRFPTGITSRTGLTVYDTWIFTGDEEGVAYAYNGP